MFIRFLLVAASFFLSDIMTAQNLGWAGRFSGLDANTSESIAIDSSGNIYSVGFFKGTVDFDPRAGIYNLTSVNSNSSDMFVCKLNGAGGFTWAFSIGRILDTKAKFVEIDPDQDVIVSGDFQDSVDFDPGINVSGLWAPINTDGFVAKYSSTGQLIWAKDLGGDEPDEIRGMTLDDNGNIFITGYFEGTADFDPGPGVYELTSAAYRDMFIVKLDNNGNFIWAKRIGGNGETIPRSIRLDNNGNIYTVGMFYFTNDFDPDTSSLAVYNMVGSVDGEFFILKLDSTGSFLWAKQVGGTQYTDAFKIITDDNGDVYVGGTFSLTVDFDPGSGIYNMTAAGNQDGYLLKLDPIGNFIRANRIGGTNGDGVYDIIVNDSGYVYITGYFGGTVDFDPGSSVTSLTSSGMADIFICKWDSLSNFIWTKKFGGTLMDLPSRIVQRDGNLFLTGEFEGSCDVDPTSGIMYLVSGGDSNGFVLRLGASLVGIDESEATEASFELFPNPGTCQWQIEFNNPQQNLVSIYDVTGKCVFSSVVNSDHLNMDIAVWCEGLYIVSVNGVSKKAIIQR